MSPQRVRFANTNIFLRFLTDDVPKQAERCAQLIRRLRDGEEVVEISEVAVAEMVWTLESFYGLSKGEVVLRVLPILKLKGLKVANKTSLLEALDTYAELNVDFVDAYTASLMRRRKREEIYSYDRDFDRMPWVRRVEP